MMYAPMPQCIKIIIGGSHDNGYARLLSKLETGNVVPGKVMLLEGRPFATELQRVNATTFPRIKFGNLFLETKLEPGKNMKYSQVAATDGLLKVSPKLTCATPRSTAVGPFKVPYKTVEPEYCNLP
jgi:hypothetical protein